MFIHDQCFDVYADIYQINDYFGNVESNLWCESIYPFHVYDHIRMFCGC